MKQIWIIAKNTFTETIRQRILYIIIGFSVAILLASLLASSVSLGQDARVIQSFGLTAILAFLLIITLFVGTQMLYREMEQKTIYLTLTRPVSRESFYLGKFVGLCLVLAACAAMMGLIYIGLLWWRIGFVNPSTYWAIGFILMEIWLIIALGMLFGSFTSPIASALYSFGLIIIGHSATTIFIISQNATEIVRYILQGAYYLLPNLEKFNLRNEVIYDLAPTATQTLSTFGYFAGYTGLLLILGLIIFRRSEF